MFETRSIPATTTRKGIFAITSRVLKGLGCAAFLLLFLLAAVSNAHATVTITPVVSSSASPTYGANITLTATMSTWVSAAGGTLTFETSTSSTGTYTEISTCGTGGTITVATTTPTCVVNNLPVGATYVKAVYATTATGYAGATSAAFMLTVAAAATTISISNIPAAAPIGGSFTPAYTYSAPTGSPTFSVTTTAASTICTVGASPNYLVSFIGSGSCPLKAAATATTDYAAATGTVQTVTVKKAATLTLGSLSQTYTGSPLSATVSVSNSVPSTEVTFTYTGSGGTTYATSATAPTNAGTYAVVATLATDTTYAGSASGTMTILEATQAALSVTGVPGSAQAYNASFTVGSSGGSGSGTVTYAATGACSNASALVTMTSGSGTCSVTATKGTDGNYTSLTSSASTVSATLATQAALSVTGVPGSAQAYGATFTVGSSGGSGAGAVTYAATGSCTNASSLVTISSGTGTCSVTATKAADADYASSTSGASTVSATTATLGVSLGVTSAQGAVTVAQGTSVTLTASVTPASMAYGNVTFTVAGNSIVCTGSNPAAVSSGTATCVTTQLPVGQSQALVASFTQTQNTADFTGATVASTGNSISVIVAPTVTVAPTVASLPTAQTFYYDASVTMSVSGFPGGAAGGSVTFYDNGSTSLGTCTLNSSGGCTAATISSLALGSHSISASYAGYNGYPAAASAAQSITVIANPTLVALVANPTAVYLTSGTTTLTATVTTADSITVPGGHVTFYDSTTSLGQATVGAITAGVATLTVPAGTMTTPGTHYIIASYGGVYSSGAAQFGTSLSHAAQVVVENAQTISNWFNKSTVYGTPIVLAAVSSSASDSTNGELVVYTVLGTTGNITSASLSGSTLTPNGVGSITIQANIAGNSFYTAATPVSRTFTVYPRPLTVTASSPTAITYGASAPTITATYSGWSTTPADSSASLTTAPTCTSGYTASANNHPGTYTTYCYDAVDPNYDITYTNGTFTLNKATPVFGTAPTAAAITYGPLSTSTLTGGTATGPFGSAISGHYVWTNSTAEPPANVSPAIVSVDTPSVNFNPSDTTDYNTLANATEINISVTKANPTITWPAPITVSAGAVTANSPSVSPALSSVSSSSGGFTWTTPGTTITTGANSVSVTYTPNNPSYNILTHNLSVTGSKPAATVPAWPAASAITYGAKLSSSTLTVAGNNGTSYAVTNGTNSWTGNSGAFAWTTPSTTPANSGTSSYNVTFTPTDTVDYSSVTQSVSVLVNQATPTVSSWPAPSSITFGQALSASTLSGGSTSGTFAWQTTTTQPLAGLQAENMVYTPTNTNYSSITQSINIYVDQATPTSIVWPTAGGLAVGQTLDNSVLSSSSGSGTAPYGGATVDGDFGWTCLIGGDTCTAPPVGTSQQSVTFTPTDNSDYTTVPDSLVNITVNACGKQDSVNSSYSAALNGYDKATEANLTSPTLDVSSGVASTGSDVSAVCATDTSAGDGTAITISYPTITSETTASAGAIVDAPSTTLSDVTAYGTNAAVLAYGTATTAGQGATINIVDDGDGNPGSIQTSNDYSAGVFASYGGTVDISNTYITTGMTTGNYAPAFKATEQGTLTITNTSSQGGAGNGPVYATTLGNNSPVLATGLGGGIINSTANAYSSAGTESAGVHAAGASSGGTGSTINLNGDSITTATSSLVEVNGKSTVTITSTGAPATLYGMLGDNHGIFLYYDSTPGEATAGASDFTMTGGYLTYTCDATSNAACAPSSPAGYQNSLPTLFSVTNTTANIALTDVYVTNDTPYIDAESNQHPNGNLLIAGALAGLAGGSTVNFNANGEALIGDIIVDSTSTVNFSLSADSSSVPSTLTGTIDGANVSGGQVNLTLDAASTWVVTGNSYVKTLTNAVSNNSNITCFNPGQCVVYVDVLGTWTPAPGIN
jgi:hypothetical protein